MVQYPIGSMVMLYMVTWIPSIYPLYDLYVSIYTSTMDPMGFSNQMQLSLDSAAQPIVTVHGAEIWTICDMALEDTKATGATPVAYTKNALWNDAAHCPHLPTKASREGMEEGFTKIYSVVICRIHAHIHISTDWLWHAFDDVGTCWACFFRKENGSKPIPRKNGTRNPSSTATISNHWNPADLRWFIFPNRPTCKNLAGGTRPWRLRGSRTTMNKKWKNSLHLSAYEGLPPNTRFRRNIFVRYVIITNLLLQPSYWTGPPECFQRKNMVFPPSTCHHMIIWSTTGYPEVQGCACLPIFLGHPHVKNEPTAICMHPEHHDHWYGHILYAAT